MGDVIGPVILGIIISILGISNMKGNISSLHWYHRQRVSPDDVMPFGKRVGLGTLIIGIAIIVFGLFSLITYLTEIEVYTIIGAALLIPAVIVGLGLSLYAIIKYNKGLFCNAANARYVRCYMKKRIWKRLFIALLCLALISGVTVLGINGHVKKSTADQILSPEEAATLTDVDCILVLGCYVHDSGRPSDMLADRLRRGIELYQSGAAPKLLMSGDHGQKDYNEVKAMKLEAMDEGIPSEDIFMDHAGFSTYESIFRARDVFAADKIIIVTQEYHLYRALHVANALGVEAYGVAADYHTYVGQAYRELREILARNKDFATSILKPEPTYLGDVIPVSGDGDLTNDGDMEPVLS